MVGHRSSDFQKLYSSIQPGLKKLFGTKQPVFLSTSSAWGVMEGAIRNLVSKRVLNCMCGAFSDKWFDVSKRCGKEADSLRVEWGQPILPEMLDQRLASGLYDAVTIIHNETSTGVMNPLAELCEVLRHYPDVLSIVDTVSSLSVVPIAMDKLGADVVLAGSQKALSLPPGLAVFAVSERAFAKAATLNDRGYYFDFLEFLANHEKNMTPSTPAISQIFALRSKLEDMEAEGLEKRFERHAKLNAIVGDWVLRNGFEFFAPEGYRAKSLTCIRNSRGVDVPSLISTLKERYHCIIDGGYGKLKGNTFRISNMGDETEETIGQLLEWLDDCLP